MPEYPVTTSIDRFTIQSSVLLLTAVIVLFASQETATAAYPFATTELGAAEEDQPKGNPGNRRVNPVV